MRTVWEVLREFWCSWFHGGGWIMRDPSGRVNWQCQKCGRWADPVPLCEEVRATDAAIKQRKKP
jgi:hypothetical protein